MSTARRAWKILVTHPEVPKVILEFFAQHNCETIVCECLPPSRAELLAKARGVDGIFMTFHGFGPLNAEVLDAAGPQLRVICTMSSGVDIVDVPEMRRRGITLGHTPHALNDAVADLTVGLMLAAARRFYEGRLIVESGVWENHRLNWMAGRDIRGATIGFFGFGGIGQAIAKRLMGFSIGKILYNTRRKVSQDIEKEFNASHTTFENFLTESDYIIVIAPLTKDTERIFNACAFVKMKKTCVFVNAARGGLVDHDDLYEALKSETIFAAGLDVMSPEPLPANHRLLELPNCIILPHLGASTERTRLDMAMLAAKNILLGLAGERMLTPVK